MSSLPNNSKAQVPWSTGLCDCFSDRRTCLMSCCCPCVIFGRITEIVNKGKISNATSGVLYVALSCLVGPCLYSAPIRSKLRNEYNVKGTRGQDCLVHCFCEPCALTQEYRELQSRGFDMKLGWEENMEKQNRPVATAPVVEIGMKR
ncbi:protein PLANT CADMIUM RESISTANCE 3-like [Ricinus communis]|uniref:protein PLANT CADMIUM RESISTANCE 3-like n=1 Tax=Ricinus communis TaxID=3988 RepID=UPI000772383A|nr:protein PLANT CADMIUM RESISTANCE 3-like [Ricinus communis]|eukprot:XP_015580023.1 protein PLANT CADMIUM RESISTANCE 3-like [Ricinus communis]